MFEWLNEDSRTFLKRGYLTEGIEPENRIREICNKAEDILGIDGYSDILYDYCSKGWVSFSSPVWANFGLNRGLPISCNTSFLDDSMESILYTQAEVGMLTKNGAGTGAYFGELRPRGAKITDNGESSGAVNFMQLFETTMDVVSQGSCFTPRHSVLTDYGYIPFENLKKENFSRKRIGLKKLKIAQANQLNEVLYTKNYEIIEEEYSGDVYTFNNLTVTANHRMWVKTDYYDNFYFITAEELYRKLEEEAYYFIDDDKEVIEIKTSGRKHYNGKVYCVIVPTGRIVVEGTIVGNTRRGNFAAYLPIDHKDIEEFLEIRWEGNPIQNIFTAVCVPDYWLEEMKAGDSEKRKIWAKVLKSRSELGIPYIFFSDNVDRGKPQVYKDKNLKIKHSNLCCVTSDTLVKTINGEFPIIELYENQQNFSKKPLVWNGQEYTESEILYSGPTNEIIEVQLREKKSGKSKIIRCTENHVFYIEKVWSGDKYLEHNDKVFAHSLSSGDVLQKLSVDTDETTFVVENVIKLKSNKNISTFCVSEPKRNICSFNGILTGQSEILEYTDSEKTFVCDLAAVNLIHYDEWKDTDLVYILTLFLDAVMTEYIEKTEGVKFLERVNKFSKEHRSLGLGVLGWHSYLQSKMIPFESMSAKYINSEIFEHIQQETIRASKWMAEKFGEPEMLKGYGLRNTTLVALMPTKSSSFIMGQASQSIEPLRSNYFVKDLAKIKSTYKNPYLEELLEEKGKNTKEIWESIKNNNGSVLHLDFLTEEEKSVFKCFHEINQKEIIIQAAQRQKYIDQGQSLNLMIHEDAPLKDINNLHLFAWESGIKTLYYQLPVQNAAQKFNRSLLNDCTSCSV